MPTAAGDASQVAYRRGIDTAQYHSPRHGNYPNQRGGDPFGQSGHQVDYGHRHGDQANHDRQVNEGQPRFATVRAMNMTMASPFTNPSITGKGTMRIRLPRRSSPTAI